MLALNIPLIEAVIPETDVDTNEETEVVTSELTDVANEELTLVVSSA